MRTPVLRQTIDDSLLQRILRPSRSHLTDVAQPGHGAVGWRLDPSGTSLPPPSLSPIWRHQNSTKVPLTPFCTKSLPP